MHAIMGFSNLLINFYNNKSELETYTGYINKYCNDLLAIISDILDIAKIESGQLTVVKEQCDVNELFAELKAMFSEHQKQINKEHVSLIMRCDTDICMFTDRLKLKQILINLINNAFKFTDEGSVVVGCKVEEDDQICFYVKDSGIGISAENQMIIFERFAQLENPSTRSYGGNGLGLSIVKGLVCLLGGEINIASELGKGSTFYLKIPAL
jgi:signal transduction histidine kinase